MACVDSTVLTGFKHTPVMHRQYMLSFVGAQSCDLLNALLDIWLVQQKSPGQRITCHALDMLEGLLDTVSPPQHASQPMHPLARALVEPDTKIQPNTRTSDLRQQLPARMIQLYCLLAGPACPKPATCQDLCFTSHLCPCTVVSYRYCSGY